MRIATFVWMGLLLVTKVFGQTGPGDSIVSISEIVVESTHLSAFTMGQKVLAFDSLTLSQNQNKNLADLLTSNTALQIKTYNYNGLSTIAFRGTSAQHTGIYWNGFQLNPSNSGLLDLSLVPAGFFNRINVMYGGGSSLYGSGNIGGSIHLDNDPVFGKGNSAKFNIGLGSFGEYQTGAGYEISKHRFYSKTSVSYRTAKNDFPYTDLSGETKRQQNGAMYRIGLMQDFYGKAGKGQWGANLWLQDYFREIPASLTAGSSNAEQSDRSARGVVNYKYPVKLGYLDLRSAYFYDYYRFYDPDSLASSVIDSRLKTGKFSTEAAFSRSLLKTGQFRTGVIYKLETGKSINWNGNVVRSQLGVFALYMHAFPKLGWKAHLNLRQDFERNYSIPFTPSFGAEGRLIRNLEGRLSVSRNFRIPTFNDLYWVGSGQRDLKPEDSWNEEAGLVYKFVKDSNDLQVTIGSNVFSSQVNNWIIWVPKGEISIPQNIQEVWARGIEAEANVRFKWQPLLCLLSGGYTYTRSTSIKKRWEYDQAYEKQLIYIPVHRFYGKLTVHLNKYSLSYNHTFTGIQYTSSDNLEYLAAFQTADIIANGSFIVNHHRLLLQIQLRNIWNARYQLVLNYPNPGRSILFSLTFNLNSQ